MIKFNNDIPIYLQIADRILKDIISKRYRRGEQIPTVRELARIYSANPNTCQRALSELEDKGLLLTKSTSGKFVTENEELIDSYRREVIEGLVDSFLREIREVNGSEEEIIILIKKKREGEYGGN